MCGNGYRDPADQVALREATAAPRTTPSTRRPLVVLAADRPARRHSTSWAWPSTSPATAAGRSEAPAPASPGCRPTPRLRPLQPAERALALEQRRHLHAGRVNLSGRRVGRGAWTSSGRGDREEERFAALAAISYRSVPAGRRPGGGRGPGPGGAGPAYTSWRKVGGHDEAWVTRVTTNLAIGRWRGRRVVRPRRAPHRRAGDGPIVQGTAPAPRRPARPPRAHGGLRSPSRRQREVGSSLRPCPRPRSPPRSVAPPARSSTPPGARRPSGWLTCARRTARLRGPMFERLDDPHPPSFGTVRGGVLRPSARRRRRLGAGRRRPRAGGGRRRPVRAGWRPTTSTASTSPHLDVAAGEPVTLAASTTGGGRRSGPPARCSRPARSRRAALLSIPRDLMVDALRRGVDQRHRRPGALVGVVESQLGVGIDHYVR